MSHANTIREFVPADLEWLRPVATEYREWESLLYLFPKFIKAFVIEPYAIFACFEDPHGFCVAGVTGPQGIRAMIRLSKKMAEWVDGNGLTVHGHWQPGTWQSKLAHYLDCIEIADSFYERHPKGVM
jgi:hypothetical protein